MEDRDSRPSIAKYKRSNTTVKNDMPLKDKIILGPIDKYMLYSNYFISMNITNRPISMEDVPDIYDSCLKHNLSSSVYQTNVRSK